MRLARVSIDGAEQIVAQTDDGRLAVVTAAVGDVGLVGALMGDAAGFTPHDLSAFPTVPESRVRWLTPIESPRRILCVGFNYGSHAREMDRDRPGHPTFFVRFPSTLVAHEHPLTAPQVSAAFDWEGEIAVVIGRAGRDIPRGLAMQHVAGFTAFADNTVRDFQMHSSQATAGKNFDDSGSYGPFVVSTGEAGDPALLRVVTTISGTEFQNGSLAELLFDIPAIIEYVSSWTRLEPGDVIATGTPSGIGYRQEPPRYLVPGDEVVVEIPGLVRLRNTVA